MHFAYLVFLFSLCVTLNDIFVHCMSACCMTNLFLFKCMYCLSVWDTQLSPYFQLASLDRPFLSFVLMFDCLVGDLLLLAYLLTELVIRSKV